MLKVTVDASSEPDALGWVVVVVVAVLTGGLVVVAVRRARGARG